MGNDDSDRLDDLENRIEILENSKNYSHVRKKMEEFEDKLDNLQEELSEIKEDKADEKEVKNISSKLESIEEELTKFLKSTSESRIDMKDSVRQVRQRVSNIENELGIKDWESLVPETACEMEKLASIPRDSRKDKVGKSLYRATIIWENFEKWSETVKKGKILNSKSLKNLLEAELGENLAWTQVYRSMEKFCENSPEHYTLIENNTVGKAILES